MIPLYSAEQIRLADEYAIKELKIPSSILMENAAISITEAILQKYPYIDLSYTFGIVCGKGNNGGDGFALARHLLIKGFQVKVLFLGEEKQLKGDALLNYKILANFIKDYKNSGITNFRSIKDITGIQKCEIIVDAILGTGSIGELKGPLNNIINKLNSIPALKIAVDSPTGLNLDQAIGENIFKSDLTVTLAGLKTGLFYGKGKLNSGKVLKGSIGIGEKYFSELSATEYLIEPEDIVNFLPTKEDDIHKYSAGKIFVLAGSQKMPGAAIFAMNSAMTSGAGAGILGIPKSIQHIVQSEMNSAIVSGYEDQGRGFLSSQDIDDINENIKWADAIAIGPGLGRENETKNIVLDLLKVNSNKKFVIDADALFALGNNNYKKLDLLNKVLTPHYKEFSTLIGIELEKLKSNLLYYGKKFVLDTGSFLVLKGAPTIIFNPDGEVFINSTGNPGLAKFGSGDVLTGIISSFLAQQDDIEKSVISAVYLHGLTADLILRNESEFGITPQKLIDDFSNSIKFLRKSIV